MIIKAEEKVKQRLIKKLGNELLKGWEWHGTRFYNLQRAGVTTETWVLIHFTAGYGWLKANLLTEGEYGIPDSVRMFTGENAIEEMIKWTTDKLYEIHKIVSERIAPYIRGQIEYERALRGRL